jgi:DNA-binding GntR family transcriptional regulator
MALRAYEHIRSKLLHGDLAPGTRLRYGPIGKEIGISATPVREAMGKLAAEGLVEVLPEVGAVVRTLDHEEAIELYQMREPLETCAAGLAAEKLTDVDLAELQSLLERIASFGVALCMTGQKVMSDTMRREYAATDMAFHNVILKAAGNRALLKTVGDFHILSRAFAEDPTDYNLTMVAQAFRDHGRILRALVERDAPGARRAMERHIQNARKMALSGFEHKQRKLRKSKGRGQDSQEVLDALAGASAESVVCDSEGE